MICYVDIRVSSKETQLFYCNCRYYNLKSGRWILSNSIDYLNLESINGLNLYIYCADNPISYVDPTGHFAWLILAAFAFFATTRATANTIGQYQSIGKINWTEVAIKGIYGVATGAMMVATGGAFSIGKLIIRSVFTAIAMGVKNFALVYNDTLDFDQAGMAGLKGILIGGIVGFAFYLIFPPTNITQVNFITGSSTAIGFGWLSGIKDKEQEAKWPWEWA